jgi:hypothetical protein
MFRLFCCTGIAGGFEVAWGWLLVAYRLPTKWLCGAFVVALAGLGLLERSLLVRSLSQ